MSTTTNPSTPAQRIRRYAEAHDQLGANVDHEVMHTVWVGDAVQTGPAILRRSDLGAVLDALDAAVELLAEHKRHHGPDHRPGQLDSAGEPRWCLCGMRLPCPAAATWAIFEAATTGEEPS